MVCSGRRERQAAAPGVEAIAGDGELQCIEAAGQAVLVLNEALH